MQVNGTIEVQQDIEGEAEALTIGVHAALRMIQATGAVTPAAIALAREGAGWRGVWQMNVSQALMRGQEGMQELGYIVAKLVSPTGCDLSAIGVAPEHFKADGVLVVTEGKATDNGPHVTEPTEWRSVSVELRTHGGACALLYRVTEQASEHGTEVTLTFVARSSTLESPLNARPETMVLH